MPERRWCEIALHVREQRLEVETSSDFRMYQTLFGPPPALAATTPIAVFEHGDRLHTNVVRTVMRPKGRGPRKGTQH